MTRIHIELTRCFRLRTFYSRTIHRQLPPIPIHNLAPPHTTTNTRALLPERPFRWASEWGSMMILRKKRVNRHRDIIVEKYSPEKRCGCAVGRGCPFRGSSSNSQIREPSSQTNICFWSQPNTYPRTYYKWIQPLCQHLYFVHEINGDSAVGFAVGSTIGGMRSTKLLV